MPTRNHKLMEETFTQRLVFILQNETYEVLADKKIPTVGLRPDIYIRNKVSGKQYAIEFAVTHTGPQYIRERSNKYKQRGIIPLWMFWEDSLLKSSSRKNVSFDQGILFTNPDEDYLILELLDKHRAVLEQQEEAEKHLYIFTSNALPGINHQNETIQNAFMGVIDCKILEIMPLLTKNKNKAKAKVSRKFLPLQGICINLDNNISLFSNVEEVFGKAELEAFFDSKLLEKGQIPSEMSTELFSGDGVDEGFIQLLVSKVISPEDEDQIKLFTSEIYAISNDEHIKKISARSGELGINYLPTLISELEIRGYPIFAKFLNSFVDLRFLSTSENSPSLLKAIRNYRRNKAK